MADAVSSSTLYESASDLVMKFTNISDGTGETDVVKVDVSALAIPCAEVDIVRCLAVTSGMAVRIEFDATTDTVAILVPTDMQIDVDFACSSPPGFLKNNSGAGKTGDILFTTIGHTAGDTYDITLWMRKRQAAGV